MNEELLIQALAIIFIGFMAYIYWYLRLKRKALELWQDVDIAKEVKK